MKKRMALLCLIPALLMNFFGCKKAPVLMDPVSAPYSEEEPLMATVETKEKAEELAELYGITLVNYSYQIATFHTSEDPQEVIARGKANGWPELTLNTLQRAM